MRIYFVGAHATGKTSLTRWVSQRFKLPMIAEIARQVLAELEAPLSALRTDMTLVDHYQREIFERQVAAERKAGDSLVSDRAFDNVAYAAEHATVFADLINSPDMRDYMTWVAGGIVFFTRPHRTLLVADGTRETPEWEGVLRIDGMVKLLLEQFRVPYIPLASLSMQERVRTIELVCLLASAERK